MAEEYDLTKGSKELFGDDSLGVKTDKNTIKKAEEEELDLKK